MKSKKIFGTPVRAPSVQLDASTESDAPKWLEVAYEGRFAGHWMGKFEFTRATFEQIVANFHAHPAYQSGAESASADVLATGAFDVVQWDWHHASEAPPTSGDIAVVGAPAQGWVLDVRHGQREDGKACLFALTRWLEPARTYVKEKRYKWCSVSVVFDAVDPVTKKPVGAVLTSIAITNHPFLQDLPAIAASIYRDEWVPTKGPQSIVDRLRIEFELDPKSPDDELISKLDELKRWAAPGAVVPDGVDVEHAIQALRCILNLPYLASTDEVFAEIGKLFAPAGANNKENQMTVAASVQPAAKTPAEDLRDSLAVMLAASKKVEPTTISNTNIMLAMEQGSSAMADLAALFQGLDVKNLAGALEQIGKLQQIKTKLDELLPKYQEAQEQIEQMDVMDTDEDVGMALASLGFDPADPSKDRIRASLTRDRKANRDQFRKDYGIDDKRKLARRSAVALDAVDSDVLEQLTTRRQHTQTGDSIMDGVALRAGGRIRQEPVIGDKPGTGNQRVDLSKFSGRNLYEKAMSFVRAQPGGKDLALDTVHEQAGELLRASAA